MKAGGLAALLAWSAVLRGQAVYEPSAQVFAPALSLIQGPRALGAGGAHAAVADDAFALAWNPAGLDLIREPQLALIHNEWNSALGLRQEVLAYAQSFSFGGLGLGLGYFSLGNLDLRDSSGVLSGQTSGSNLSGTLAYGRGMLYPGLRLGLALEAAVETLGQASQSAAAFSAGALFKGRSLDYGLSLLHQSLAPGTFLPTSVKLGLAWHPGQAPLKLMVDAGLPSLGARSLHLGGEWEAMEDAWVRAGWRQYLGTELERSLSGPGLGLGAKLGPVRVDYAFVPQASLGATHQLSAVLHFDAEFFGAKILVQARNATATARAHFRQGKAFLDRGQKLEALVSYKQGLQFLPDDGQAQEAVARLLRELKSEGGKDPAFQALINAKMEAGDRFFAQGQYAKAVREWEMIVELDRDATAAYQKIMVAKQKLLEATQARVEAAATALNAGRLADAVRGYRQALSDFPHHPVAMAQIKALHPRILDEVRRLHRQGIADYVEGNYLQARERWQLALDMDPSDPRRIRRDLERVKARLEIMQSSAGK